MMIKIYQIYFDDSSFNMLDPGFIPLDNRTPINPELYEFSVIYQFFKNNGFDDECYYGFLSPSFYNKTAVTSSQLYDFIKPHINVYDAFFISSGWDQIAFHKNVFYQGEYFHPGFITVASEFFHAIGGDAMKVINSCSVFSNSVFSNYVIANATYWREWYKLADQFYAIYQSGLVDSLRLPTIYAKSDVTQAVFLQERLHSYLLMVNSSLRVLPYDTTQTGPMLLTMFTDSPLNRKLIRSCEALKCQYLLDGDESSLHLYQRIQEKVIFS